VQIFSRSSAPAPLAEWFPQHASTMDAMLAQFMQNAGFDPGGNA